MKIRQVGAELLHAEGRADLQTDTHRHDEAKIAKILKMDQPQKIRN